MRMEWRNELREIVKHATITPTFEDWLKTMACNDLPEVVSGPLHMHSVMLTLYQRYKRTFGIS